MCGIFVLNERDFDLLTLFLNDMYTNCKYIVKHYDNGYFFIITSECILQIIKLYLQYNKTFYMEHHCKLRNHQRPNTVPR